MLPRTDVEHRTPSPAHRESQPPVPEPRAPEHLGPWLRERVEPRVAVVVAVAWFVLFQVAALLEPQTSHAVPVVAVVLEVGMWVLLGATVVGLATRRRWGLLASLGGAGVATAASIACPTTGHHPVGAWWFGQMACVLALVAVSAWALRTPAASDAGELHEEGAGPRP
jgi:hypothetical protein